MLEQSAYYISRLAAVLFLVGLIYFLFIIDLIPQRYSEQDRSNSIVKDHSMEFALFGARVLSILFVVFSIAIGAIWNLRFFLNILPCGMVTIFLLSVALYWRQKLSQGTKATIQPDLTQPSTHEKDGDTNE